MKTDIAVLGGGASGLCAALAAKEEYPAADVMIVEKLPRVGKKIIATGNGKCNLSNLSLAKKNFHGKAWSSLLDRQRESGRRHLPAQQQLCNGA